MRPLKKFLVAPVLLVVLVPVVSVIPSQVIAGSRQNVHGAIRGHHRTRAAMTIWERMRDPKGWWQSRVVRSHEPGRNPRVRSSGSGMQPLAEGAITNPVFFTAPTFGSAGRSARNTEIGDFNGDGKLDLLISNECLSDADCTQGTVAVLLGNGDGTYQPALGSNAAAVLASGAIGYLDRAA